MEEVKFEKVSEDQFIKDCLRLFPKMTKEEAKKAYANIVLPVRGTANAAGYDIRTPVAFSISKRRRPITIPTGIRIKMKPDQFLLIAPRSGLGFKTGVPLANTIGVIDSDYANSDNEGHIMIKFVPGFAKLTAASGDRVVQGIILNYCTVSNDTATGERTGGLGSTGTD